MLGLCAIRRNKLDVNQKTVELVNELLSETEKVVVLIQPNTKNSQPLQKSLDPTYENTLVQLSQMNGVQMLFTDSEEHTANLIYEIAQSEAKNGFSIPANRQFLEKHQGV